MWFDELNGHKDMPIQPGGTPVPPQALTEGEGLRGLKTRLSIATFVILSLVFVATLLLVGMALFGSGIALLSWLLEIFGGRQSARSLHSASLR